MSWNLGGNRKLFLKLKSNVGFYHVVLTTAKTSPECITLIVVEMQHIDDMEETDFKKEIPCMK